MVNLGKIFAIHSKRHVHLYDKDNPFSDQNIKKKSFAGACLILLLEQVLDLDRNELADLKL